MPKRTRPFDDDETALGEEPTAQPSQRPRYDDDAEDRVVPTANVGGAAPTELGGDSGGDLPGSIDDLSSLSEPEPPEPPEVDALHVSRSVESDRRRG
ncbi:hypothetical protein [Anaeromyxobacter paludicola]|uniref:Uncharacterized protein n=1 Tax=Anaeromyxobacter paludicola TaxID=2918171 RepID=A0ABM7XBU5_9BACT|nr:hypothetical protein [Anaeromyxobacter paludicola]BDG09297.1 hypothetical protein AMPC_24100 [Anaeromyxobacter paludicola]